MAKKMNRRYKRYRACTRKKRYRNQISAVKAGAQRGLNWYRCPYCRGWHLTSKNTLKANHK